MGQVTPATGSVERQSSEDGEKEETRKNDLDMFRTQKEGAGTFWDRQFKERSIAFLPAGSR